MLFHKVAKKLPHPFAGRCYTKREQITGGKVFIAFAARCATGTAHTPRDTADGDGRCECTRLNELYHSSGYFSNSRATSQVSFPKSDLSDILVTEK